MPLGTASIIDDDGSIKADDPPSPVSFISSRFPDVTDGMRVYFERRSDVRTRARLVRPASAAEQLASLASPSFGLTPRARWLVNDTANDLSATIDHVAGRPIEGDAAFDAPIAEMTVIAARLEEHGRRVGISMVRIAILKPEASASPR